MNKFFSFMTGAVCGVLVGAVTTLLLTPTSGGELVTEAERRWLLAKREAKQAMDERRAMLENQFETAKRS
jgi:gas vesicle protein